MEDESPPPAIVNGTLTTDLDGLIVIPGKASPEAQSQLASPEENAQRDEAGYFLENVQDEETEVFVIRPKKQRPGSQKPVSRRLNVSDAASGGRSDEASPRQGRSFAQSEVLSRVSSEGPQLRASKKGRQTQAARRPSLRG